MAGFADRGSLSPIISNAVFRKIAKSAPPHPIVLDKPDEAIRHEGDLVTFQAILEVQEDSVDHVSLRLNWSGTPVISIASRTVNFGAFPRYDSGTLLSVTGIVMAQNSAVAYSGLVLPDKYNLLLRTGADVRVVRPAPWLTRPHATILIGGLAIGLAGALTLVIIASQRKLTRERSLRALQVSEYKARLAERSRMARELHDTVAQGLGAISLQLELAQRPRQPTHETNPKEHVHIAHQLVRTVVSEVRSFIRNLRSEKQPHVGLPTALQRDLEQVLYGSPIQSQFALEGTVAPLSEAVETQIARITQEAVVNAAKHSDAKMISVTLRYAPDQVAVAVHDDGVGFDTSRDWSRDGHWGLLGMKERAALIAGSLSIKKKYPRGTQVHLGVDRRDSTVNSGSSE